MKVDEHKTDDSDKGESDGDKNTGDKAFTPEQQLRIDGLIGEAYKKALKQGTVAGQEATAALQEKFDALEASIKKPKGDDGKQSEDLTALKKQLADMLAREARGIERARHSALLAAISEHSVINAGQIAQLISPSIKPREGDSDVLIVVNADGGKRVGAKGDDMTVKERVAEFLVENPHLVKASSGSGSGSQGGQFGRNGVDNKAILKMQPVERINAVRAAAEK